MFRLADQSCATRLDGLNLADVDWQATVAGRQVRDVKVDTLGGLDRAQLGAGGATNSSFGIANRLLKRTVLLSVVAVAAE